MASPSRSQRRHAGKASFANYVRAALVLGIVFLGGSELMMPRAFLRGSQGTGTVEPANPKRTPTSDAEAEQPRTPVDAPEVLQWSPYRAGGQAYDTMRYEMVREELGARLQERGYKTGVELGVQSGVFAKAILSRWQAAERYVLVDVWRQLDNYVDGANVDNSKQEMVYQKALSNTRAFGSKVEVCRDLTVACAEKYEDQSFDFIYVDARHDYIGVVEDLRFWLPKLRPGGIIAGHDYLDAVTHITKQPSHVSHWEVNLDGSLDITMRAVKGAVNDFFGLRGDAIYPIDKSNTWKSWVVDYAQPQPGAGAVPRVLHFFWLSEDLVRQEERMPQDVLDGIAQWEAAHRTWPIVIWTNEMAEASLDSAELEALRAARSGGVAAMEAYLRVVVLRKYGGIGVARGVSAPAGGGGLGAALVAVEGKASEDAWAICAGADASSAASVAVFSASSSCRSQPSGVGLLIARRGSATLSGVDAAQLARVTATKGIAKAPSAGEKGSSASGPVVEVPVVVPPSSDSATKQLRTPVDAPEVLQWSPYRAGGQAYDTMRYEMVREELGARLQERGYKTGVELGVQSGVFAKAILSRWQAAERYVLVDVWRQLDNYVDGANVDNSKQEMVYQKALSNTRAFGSKVEVCRDLTVACAEKYEDQSFDFIYVDARHDYIGVVEDLRFWLPKLRPGGIIAGHDYLDAVTHITKQPSHVSHWEVNLDGSLDITMRAVKGAVNDFFGLRGDAIYPIDKPNTWKSWVVDYAQPQPGAGAVPRVLHFFWLSEDLVRQEERMPQDVLDGIAKWEAAHRTWPIVIWTNEMAEASLDSAELEALRAARSGGVAAMEAYLRVVVLRKYGGIGVARGVSAPAGGGGLGAALVAVEGKASEDAWAICAGADASSAASVAVFSASSSCRSQPSGWACSSRVGAARRCLGWTLRSSRWLRTTHDRLYLHRHLPASQSQAEMLGKQSGFARRWTRQRCCSGRRTVRVARHTTRCGTRWCGRSSALGCRSAATRRAWSSACRAVSSRRPS